MDENNSIQLFEDRKIRTAWDEEKEEWYFSVVDVVAVLSESTDPKQYIKKMRARDPQLSANWGTICTPVQMLAADGKQRKVQAANTEGILRIIQSIPSPKAEPFKRWLAQVGRERIEETIDPEQAIDRALETYQKKGYDADWIHQRILSIRVRNELTAEWQQRGVEKGREYAILTVEITKAWSGMTTRQYKNLKGLKKENLRDNMSTLEIVLNMLAETTTTELSKAHRPEGFEESRIVARRGGKVAGDARRHRSGHWAARRHSGERRPAQYRGNGYDRGRSGSGRNRQNMQRLDTHGTIVVGSCEAFHHYNAFRGVQ